MSFRSSLEGNQIILGWEQRSWKGVAGRTLVVLIRNMKENVSFDFAGHHHIRMPLLSAFRTSPCYSEKKPALSLLIMNIVKKSNNMILY